MSHPVTDYAESVLDGEIISGKFVKWSCKRHIDDLKREDIYFDEQAATRMINFYKLTPHVKGELAGQPIILEPWQEFIVGCLFGWKNKDGTRRFREGYIQISRKNGKTTLLAPIGVYGLKFDGEAGAEIYSAATTRDQAKEIFDIAKQMIIKSKYIDDVDIFKNNLSHVESFSKFEPLSADYDTLDGKNVHFGLIDELHAHPNSGVWDVLADGTGARTQALMLAITTAGYNTESFCYRMRNDCVNVLDPDKPDFKDDTLFAYIAELDEEDDWQDPNNWIKSNPNLGISVKEDNLVMRVNKAKRMPTERNKIICKRLNIWTNAESRFMDMKHWDASAGYDIEEIEEIKKELEGEKCYTGLDLSSKIDITAYLKVFPYKDNYIIIPEFFIPEDTIMERSKADGVPYQTWKEQGFINATEGNVVHYAAIENMIIDDYEKYNILEVAHDRWGATQMAQNLDDAGLEMVPFGQGYKSMSEPMKELQKLTLEKRLIHFGHPVLRWMMDNVVAKSDPSDNIKPDKKKSQEKIDGVVALIMALDRCIRNEGENNKSRYDDPDAEVYAL